MIVGNSKKGIHSTLPGRFHSVVTQPCASQPRWIKYLYFHRFHRNGNGHRNTGQILKEEMLTSISLTFLGTSRDAMSEFTPRHAHADVEFGKFIIGDAHCCSRGNIEWDLIILKEDRDFPLPQFYMASSVCKTILREGTYPHHRCYICKTQQSNSRICLRCNGASLLVLR